MSNDIKRYVLADLEHPPRMREHPNGAYVEYYLHRRRIAELEADVERLTEGRNYLDEAHIAAMAQLADVRTKLRETDWRDDDEFVVKEALEIIDDADDWEYPDTARLREVRDIAKAEIAGCELAGKRAGSGAHALVIRSKMRREIEIHQRYLDAATKEKL
jgi:hypothetical protein